MDSDVAIVLGIILGLGIGIPLGFIVSHYINFSPKTASVVISRNAQGQIESISQV